MNILLKIALIIHIISGVTALLTGLIAIISKKGKKTHRTTGKIFFFSMLSVSASAVFIAMAKNNLFLLLIGIFAFFMNYSGYHSIKNKSLKPSLLDWLVLVIAATNSFFMFYSLNLILMVFGGLSIFLVISDFRIFLLTIRNKEIPKLQWLFRHIGMMLGTYIATSTAFLVVNVTNFNPAWVPWLMPTFIGTPLIFYWIQKYSSKNKKAE